MQNLANNIITDNQLNTGSKKNNPLHKRDKNTEMGKLWSD